MTDGVLIRDMSQKDSPRERLVQLGADALTDAELVAILLRTGTKGLSAVSIAQQLLKRFETLDRLAGAPREEICKIKGIGPDKAVTLQAAFKLAQKMARELRRESPVLDTP